MLCQLAYNFGNHIFGLFSLLSDDSVYIGKCRVYDHSGTQAKPHFRERKKNSPLFDDGV